MQRANFDPPICIPADSTVVVTTYFEASSSDFVSFASNDFGASHPTYILSNSCGLASFADLASLGFPDHHWLQILVGNTQCVSPDCLGDFNGDGEVSGGDLGMILAMWGTADGDLNGDATTDGGDLGLLLSSWGLCP